MIHYEVFVMWNDKGYTLAELMVILLIISIATSIAAYNIGGFMAYASIRTALRQMVSDIRLAQQMAVGEGQLYYLAFDRHRDLYMIKVTGHPMAKVIKRVFLEGGVDILGTNFSGDEFYFNSLGAPSRGGEITLKDIRGRVYRITVLPATGRVRVYD
jgi:prepilin-type N-terminal cleavage/methylation domain-containing protein